jgi:hypothetical protein
MALGLGFADQGKSKSIGSSDQEVQKLLRLAEQPNPKAIGSDWHYSVVHSVNTPCL